MAKRTDYQELIDEFARSELSTKEFAEAKEISIKTLYRAAKRCGFDTRSKEYIQYRGRGTNPASKAALVAGGHYSHGVHRFQSTGIVPCDRCGWAADCDRYSEGESCAILKEFQQAKIHEIMELPQVEPEDLSLVEMLCRELCLQQLIMRFTSKSGLFVAKKDGGTGLQPVMTQYWCSVNASGRLMDKLGLSPAGRKQLQTQGKVGGIITQMVLDGDSK